MKSTYEARWGHRRGEGKKGKRHDQGKRLDRERKRVEAEARNVERSKRTSKEQFDILVVTRPGNSEKERARLLKSIQE